ncbi:MAG: hypothetical protein RL346_184, partial [Verrucomicrobiota bacterium]
MVSIATGRTTPITTLSSRIIRNRNDDFLARKNGPPFGSDVRRTKPRLEMIDCEPTDERGSVRVRRIIPYRFEKEKRVALP